MGTGGGVEVCEEPAWGGKGRSPEAEEKEEEGKGEAGRTEEETGKVGEDKPGQARGATTGEVGKGAGRAPEESGAEDTTGGAGSEAGAGAGGEAGPGEGAAEAGEHVEAGAAGVEVGATGSGLHLCPRVWHCEQKRGTNSYSTGCRKEEPSGRETGISKR